MFKLVHVTYLLRYNLKILHEKPKIKSNLFIFISVNLEIK